MSHHSFSDDNQLYTSDSLLQLPSMISLTQACISDVQSWMTNNKLQLNAEKTEMILMSTGTSAKRFSFPQSVTLLGSDIPLSSAVRNLGVTLDNTLSFEQHVNNICRICYYEIRRIASIRHILSDDATKILLCAFVLSRLDYCNSLLAGSPLSLLHKLQKVQNNAVRLIFKSSRSAHVTPLLRSLHWLPIHKRIHYKIALLCFKSFNNLAPSYISDLLHVYTPSRQLRSASDTRIFRIPSCRTKTHGQRSFSYQAPILWNQLPYSVRHSLTLTSFKSSLKTHLFSQQ